MLHHLVGTDGLVPALVSLSCDHTLTALLSALLTSLLEAHMTLLRDGEGQEEWGGASLNLLLELLEEIQLQDDVVHALVR